MSANQLCRFCGRERQDHEMTIVFRESKEDKHVQFGEHICEECYGSLEAAGLLAHGKIKGRGVRFLLEKSIERTE